MDKAEILRLGETICGLSNWLKTTISKRLYSSYTYLVSDEEEGTANYESLKIGIKDLINQIINNDDEVAIKAIEPLYLLKDRIGLFYMDYTVWLLKDAPATDAFMQEWNSNNPDSSLRFGGFDYSQDYAYLSFLSDVDSELRLLSDYLQSRTPEEESDTPKKKPGRKRGEFKYFIKNPYINHSDEIIQKMKSQLDGCRGKNAAIVLIAAIKNGYITTPERASFCREFGDIIDKETYSKYLNNEQSPDVWRSKEVKEMQNRLKL